jgi:hypothetical protein
MKVLLDLDNLTDDHLDLLIGNLFSQGVMENGGELEKLGLALSQEWRRRNPEELPPSILRTLGGDCRVEPKLHLDDD